MNTIQILTKISAELTAIKEARGRERDLRIEGLENYISGVLEGAKACGASQPVSEQGAATV